MKDADKEIRDLFQKIREHDKERLRIPDFEEFVPAKKEKTLVRGPILRPIGIAAAISAVIIASLVIFKTSSNGPSVEVNSETVVLMGGSSVNSEQILNDDTEVASISWESPTSSLISDF